MGRLQHYGTVYREFISNCLAEASTYRMHFFLVAFMDLVFYATSFASVAILYIHVERIGPWNQDKFLFFIAFALAIDHIHMTFVSENFWEFSEKVRTGDLDFLLIRPLGTLFSVFFRQIRAATLLNGIVPWGAMFYFGSRAGLSGIDFALVPFLLLCAVTLQVSLEILMAMATFWTVESFGLNFLRMQMQQLSRWPDFVFRFFSQKLFTFGIPVLVIVNGPVHLLFDRSRWALFGWGIGATVVCWVLIRYFWRRGLRAYESASS